MSGEYDPSVQGNAWEEEGEGYGVEDGEDAANPQISSHQDQPSYSLEQDPHSSGDVPSASNDEAASEDGGDYDPEMEMATSSMVLPPTTTTTTTTTLVTTEPEAAAKPSPKPQAKKPKTAGGFIVDSDSEDEDDDQVDQTPGPGSGGHAVPAPSFHTHARTASPLQASITAQEDASGPASASNQQQPTPVIPHQSPAVAPSSSHAPVVSAVPELSNAQPQAAQDKIALLEDRVRDDPRGAMDSWVALLREYQDRNKIEDARNAYAGFLEVFPQAADIWADYLDMELGMNNFGDTERIFGLCLMSTPNVGLWTKYLDYIRRRNDLNDTTGGARQIVAQSYEFVIDNIGCDKDSGKIWADYIQFIKSGPGQAGGTSWQDQQKMDQLRKAYTRAICVPISNVNTLWKEYDQFEMGMNKAQARKMLAERSPAYMSAKSANTALENITRGLHRTTLPRLPPAPGFEGDQEYMDQVETWKRWIAWEKSDPLEIKEDEPELFRKRILYAYKQALMALRFWPEMWVDAAEWCFDNNITNEGSDVGLDLLRQGIAANPESVLLALKHADRIEATYAIEENDEAKIARGLAAREPYNKVLDTLYDLIKAVKEREKAEITRIEEAAAREASASAQQPRYDDEEEDDDGQSAEKSAKENARQQQINAVQQGFAAQTQLLSRTISFVWVALARAMRRIQGKGKPNNPLGGMRQVFTDARQRGRLTSDVYVAIAQLEWTVYKEPAGAKIFERGSKLFPEDENFTVEYLKFLHSRDDFTNARVVFETCVNRLTQKPELIPKSKPLYAYFHKYESQFGELAQISKLEKRMAELFPEDPKLSHFSARFSTDKFDPIAARIIVSPSTQLRPRFPIMPSIERPASEQNSPVPQQGRAQHNPRPQYLQAQATNSPKRPLPLEDFDEVDQPRKAHRVEHQDFVRGVSPLKGAAGRRLDQQRRGGASHQTATVTIPRDVNFLLGIMPPAHTYNAQRFNSSGMVRLLQDTTIPDFDAWRHAKDQRHTVQSSHSRQQSSADYPAHYGREGRDSPNPQGRLQPATATYRQSSLRPGSSDSYHPPPAAYGQGQQPPYLAGPPPPVQYDGAPAPTWPPYNAAPPTVPPPQAYAAYGQPPQQQQQQQQQALPAPTSYGHYQY